MRRIVFTTNWFSENMGYSENCLPKAVATKGFDVHLISSNAQIYYDHPRYSEIYEPFIGPNIVEIGNTEIDGVCLHRIPFTARRGRVHLTGLREQLARIRPDVIQTFEVGENSTYIAAKYSQDASTKLFTENHIHASVFDKRGLLRARNEIGRLLNRISPRQRLINGVTSVCYPISEDSARIATVHFGVPPEKIRIESLGVETDWFHPLEHRAREAIRRDIRAELHIGRNEILCIYTGRFTKSKNPHCLASAIERLQESGHPLFRGLFLGNGQREDVEFLGTRSGCITHPFVAVKELPKYYWAADIAVWPREESTSQLDAVACGLPIILSDGITVRERVDGNGFTYKENDSTDLAEKLLLLEDENTRLRLGSIGAARVCRDLSWTAVAERRIHDYEYR